MRLSDCGRLLGSRLLLDTLCQPCPTNHHISIIHLLNIPSKKYLGQRVELREVDVNLDLQRTKANSGGKDIWAVPSQKVPPNKWPCSFCFFWSKPLSWTTCDALWPILAFSSHFMGIFGPRVGFWGPQRTKFQNDCWGPFSCILLVCLHLKGCN